MLLKLALFIDGKIENIAEYTIEIRLYFFLLE